jgi:hypothetical protein
VAAELHQRPQDVAEVASEGAPVHFNVAVQDKSESRRAADSASERQRAQRQRTFQCWIPVRRFRVMSWSLAVCDNRMCLIALFLPEVTGFDARGICIGVEFEVISAASVGGDAGEGLLVDLGVG